MGHEHHSARAVARLDPTFVGIGREALGVVFGFPLFTALALRELTSAHSAVVVGLLPAATAVAAVVRAGERPSRRPRGRVSSPVATC